MSESESPSAESMLAANLDQLRRTDAALAERIATAQPAALNWAESKTSLLSATIDYQGRALALASKYNPQAEAEKLAGSYDPAKHACIVTLGVGLGYHVAHLAGDLTDRSLMIVFEPDVGQLRAVLERIDHTAWLGRANVVIVDHSIDRGAFIGRVERFSGIITQGTVLITHPPTRQMHSQAMGAFSDMVTDAMSYCRTSVATALVNSSRTIRNLSMNLAYYAAGANTNELHNAAVGVPAICVGAGPSLARNVDLLKDARVRKNVIIITAQTTLKPLLQRGITPDFVTALDYHEISKRFYEGLEAQPDITLVAEPKANPAILDHFPGPIRVTNNRFLDTLLGDQAREIEPIPHGATVAHLSFYLAQHLGCDPIGFIGQDLGFSDGLYYCPGTAIHEVWEPELGAFNTLEMMEWQRIVRHRGHLQRLEDVHGRPIFSDEQMLTYLKQFERDFATAKQELIDATEGGLPKKHTVPMTLAAMLERYATEPAPALPRVQSRFDRERIDMVIALLEERRGEVQELRRLSDDTVPLLKDMLKHQRDRDKVGRIHEQVEKNRKRVADLNTTFKLVNDLNTIGAFNRARADRAIENTSGDAFDEQARRIERDIENVQWLSQACDEALDIFRDSLDRLRTFREQAKAESPQPVAAV